MGSNDQNDKIQLKNLKSPYPIKLNCQCDHCSPLYDPPPDPPDDSDLWDLQFCRWWGWNWVRRRDVEPKLFLKDPQDDRTTQIGEHPSRSRRPGDATLDEEDHQTKGCCQSRRKRRDGEGNIIQRCLSRRRKRKKADTDKGNEDGPVVRSGYMEPGNKSYQERPSKVVARNYDDRPMQERPSRPQEVEEIVVVPRYNEYNTKEHINRPRNEEHVHPRGDEDHESAGCCQKRGKKPKTKDITREDKLHEECLEKCMSAYKKNAGTSFEPKYGEGRPKAKYDEEMPRTKYNEDMPRTKYNEEMPRTKYNAEMPRTKYNEEMPRTKYNEEMPRNRYNEGMPSTKYNEEMPRTKYNEEMPRNKYNEEMPRTKYNEQMPRSKYNEDMPNARHDEEKPKKGWCAPRRGKESPGEKTRWKCGRQYTDRSQQVDSKPITVQPSRQTEGMPMGMSRERNSLPTKREFRNMCKCLLGKSPNCGMYSWYNTPSASTMVIEGWPKCGPYKLRQPFQEEQRKVQSYPEVRDNKPSVEKGAKSTEGLMSKSQECKKCCKEMHGDKHISEPISTGESSEYQTIDLQDYIYKRPDGKTQSYKPSDTKRTFSSTEDSAEYRKGMPESPGAQTRTFKRPDAKTYVTAASGPNEQFSRPLDARERFFSAEDGTQYYNGSAGPMGAQTKTSKPADTKNYITDPSGARKRSFEPDTQRTFSSTEDSADYDKEFAEPRGDKTRTSRRPDTYITDPSGTRKQPSDAQKMSPNTEGRPGYYREGAEPLGAETPTSRQPDAKNYFTDPSGTKKQPSDSQKMFSNTEGGPGYYREVGDPLGAETRTSRQPDAKNYSSEQSGTKKQPSDAQRMFPNTEGRPGYYKEGAEPLGAERQISRPPGTRRDITEPSSGKKQIPERLDITSTEESISVHLQQITNDDCCPCKKCDKKSGDKPNDNEQQSLSARQDGRPLNAQDQVQWVQQGQDKDNIFKIDVHSSEMLQRDFTGEEKVFKIKSKQYKTICIRVCCCGSCKPSLQEGTGKRSPGRRKLCRCKKANKDNIDANKETQVAYPVIVPPPATTKIFTKFGTPSKNYSWMYNTGSDATTTVLNDLATYTSPATGKMYDLSTFSCDSHEQLTLPDLIDITDDISYLKRVQEITTSDNESRLLLDAVCDAILQEHEEKAYDFFEENLLTSDGLKKDSTDLEFLNELKEFSGQNDAYTELSNPLLKYSHEDVGIQWSNTPNLNDIIFDPTGTLGDFDCVIGHIVEKILSDSNDDITKNLVFEAKNLDSRRASIEAKQDENLFKFKGNESNIFTNTAELSRRSNIYKKTQKRIASNYSTDENSNKKLKQGYSEVGKPEIRESITITTQTNKEFENIVTQNKIKNTHSEKVFSLVSPKHEPMYVMSENFLRTHSLGNSLDQSSSKYVFESKNPTESDVTSPTHNFDQHYSKFDIDSRKSTEMDLSSLKCGFEDKKLFETDSNYSKKFYRMSSDAFQQEMEQSALRGGKKSYEIFSNKFSSSLNDYKKKCSSIATDVIIEEKNSNSPEENIKCETFCDQNEETSMKSLDKISKLSVHSFLICDEKSTVDQKPSNSGIGIKTEKKAIKRKKISGNGSFIPVRKQSNSGIINNSL